MNDEKITELILKISTELAILNQQTKTVLDTLSKHEQRIGDLEKNKVGFKDQIVKWLVIALIGSIGTIATLTGATGIIKLMMGAN